jgi:hypothetical protein
MKLGANTRCHGRDPFGWTLNHENGMASSGEVTARKQVSRQYLEGGLASPRSAAQLDMSVAHAAGMD